MNNLSDFLQKQNEQISRMMKPILMAQKQALTNVVMPSNIISKAIQPVLVELKQIITPTIDLQIQNTNRILQKFSEVVNNSGLVESVRKFHILDVGLLYLEKRNWTYPFEFEIEDLDKVLNDKRKFNKYIVQHFDEARVKRLFKECINYSNKKDYKTLLKQAQRSYLNGDYAICIIGVISCFESLFLELNLKTKSKKRIFKGYEIIKDMVDEIPEDYPVNYFLKIKKLILFGNYINNNLYCNVDLENTKLINKDSGKEIKVSRHSELHGKKFINSKYECIRLINSLWQFTEVLSEWYSEE